MCLLMMRITRILTSLRKMAHDKSVLLTLRTSSRKMASRKSVCTDLSCTSSTITCDTPSRYDDLL